MLEKLEKVITEKSEKVMTNEKVEGFVNNLGGVLCFVGAVMFGILFIVCSASLMKTGKNYVVKPVAEEKAETTETTETAPESSEAEETQTTEQSGEASE